MKKDHFFGVYYKHQAKDGFTLAAIVSTANEGDMLQIIINDGSYQILDPYSVMVDENGITFAVEQEGLSIQGKLSYSKRRKPKKDIMSYFRYLPIECKHTLYALYMQVDGILNVNGVEHIFEAGDGYIEGDAGRNFPKKYLWLNAVNPAITITLAVASIPLGLFTIQGITCQIAHEDKEYLFGTYNGAKMLSLDKYHLELKKGPYRLEIAIDEHEGHPLAAPLKGDMVRSIHECPSVGIAYILKKKEEVIASGRHEYASYEYVF